MSTTTDVERPSRARGGRKLRAAFVICSLLVGWFGSMAVLMYFVDISSKALVFGPPSQILAKADEDVRPIRFGNITMVVSSDKDGYVGQLYSAGAWLVLPSLRSGCLDLSRKRT